MHRKEIKIIAAAVVVLLAALAIGIYMGGKPEKKQVQQEERAEAPKPPASFEEYKVNEKMQAEAKDGAYNRFFLKDALQTVSIEIEEEAFADILAHAVEKPSAMAESVTIGGETEWYVGLKTKGNYTLEHTAMDPNNSKRFSFSVNFGKYVKKKSHGEKQNFYGCNKISFNNFFFDKTQMKEFCSMMLMQEMGVVTPQFGLAKLYINGEYYGVYFMVESMDSSVIEQHFQLEKEEVSDYLTKPEDSSLLYEGKLFDSYLDKDGSFDLSGVLVQKEDGTWQAKEELDTVNYLWEKEEDTLQDVAEMLPTVLSWERRLNLLSKGMDFEGKKLDVNSDRYLELLGQVLDVDEVLRYFAAHSFLVQMDNMFTVYRNYGLYVDKNGRASLAAWDYDLSFGCYFPSIAENTANYDVDVMYKDDGAQWGEGNQNLTLWAGNAEHSQKEEGICERYEEFPLFHVLYQNKKLRKQYRQYLRECTKIMALGGTTSRGKSYSPANANSYIEHFAPILKQAHEEPLGEDVYYVNDINQPADLEVGLPNLSRIIAMRAMSVMLQTEGTNSRVSGNGCDLSTLGNALWGASSNIGHLTVVDAATGISVRKKFLEGETVPNLKVLLLGKKGETFGDIMRATGCEDEEHLTAWQLTSLFQGKGEFTVYIPLEPGQDMEHIEAYSYEAGEAVKLKSSVEDNILIVNTEELEYIAMVNTAGK